MEDSANRRLKVFLCHASDDKPIVRKLYSRLECDGVDAWLDKEKLIPGQNWRIEIQKAVRNSDVVIVCLSSHSTNKEGFIQKEIKMALDTADEKPEGTIFIIPARLEDCNVPERISQLHWVDLFSDNGYELLLRALQSQANTIGIVVEPEISTYEEGSFEDIGVDHNVYENEIKGMRMHFAFSIKKHKNKKCRIVVLFEFEDGTKLKDYNNSYRTIKGYVATGEDFEPRFDNSVFEDFDIFMPYSELHLSEGHHNLRFYAFLYDNVTNSDIAYSDYEGFTID